MMEFDMDDKVAEAMSLRHAGYVIRAHTVPHQARQTTAEHSAQALSLLLVLHPEPSVNLIKAMLWHDTPEVKTGDVPAPIKRYHPQLKMALDDAELDFIDEHPNFSAAIDNLTSKEQLWLKMIDTLELMLWADDQLHLGNRYFRNVRNRCRSWLSHDNVPQQIKEFITIYEETDEWRAT